MGLVEHPLNFHDRGDRIGRDDLVRAVILVYGTRLFIVDDDILVIAHLVVGIDHEALRRMEALRHVTVQKLSYLVLGLTALLPGMRDCLAYVFEIVAKLFGSLGN